MLLCVFALRLTVATLPAHGRIPQNVNTWFDACRLSVDVFSDPPIMVVWNALHIRRASMLDRMHDKPLPGGAILKGKGGPKLSPATCSHRSSGSAQRCMRLCGFVTAGVKRAWRHGH